MGTEARDATRAQWVCIWVLLAGLTLGVVAWRLQVLQREDGRAESHGNIPVSVPDWLKGAEVVD